ncbi:UvrD-helicase domain-containing protein [Mesorhizobium sp. WSM4313]|uniref:UvrD-helicase domain-containing protein n=1 Tax=Mesorhizobium sp. WSM4313 TaxID=2029412 RepID=UPI000BAEADA6|nr:UvrD-helicase domain-containing protein [Mesorhizobium sp. WSM4313]PBB17340.1 DNA helicase UvrD [Mesorhizobium sp. WSM4313]
MLSDALERRRVLTELDRTLLVEAAAGTGKTSLIAGRVVMLMLYGEPPRSIAAITFTELAASELSLRIREYATQLLGGEIPKVLRDAVTLELLDEEKSSLKSAIDALDELTACTIHALCQQIIMAYSVETGLDPGSRMMDGPAADAMFESVISKWLFERLSIQTREGEDPVAVLSKFEPLKVVKDSFDLAKLKLEHPGAGTASIDFSLRKDIDFVESVRAFRRWQEDYPKEGRTRALVAEFETLAAFYESCFEKEPTFARLWELADPPRTASMKWNEFAFKKQRNLGYWKSAYGKDKGPELAQQAEAHSNNCETQFAELLGQIGDAMVDQMSRALDPVTDLYVERKGEAAVLDFDDLLQRAQALVTKNDAVREAVGRRFSHILVDEFQDTDPIQASILFSIAARAMPDHWQNADLRDGALFVVGDPKQSIYAFRGADIDSYNQAKRTIARLGDDRVVHIGANFRCQPGIIEYVNAAFQPVLDADGQPSYGALSATRKGAIHGLPSASHVTIGDGRSASMPEQRDDEAAIVARICSKLVGAIEIEDEHDGRRRLLEAGDIALLAPTGTDLWRYERALEALGLAVASQAGKTLLLQQETQDVLALLRTLADSRDRLAFGAFMRGPTVGLTDEELLDIAEEVHQAGPAAAPTGLFDITTPPALVSHPVARSILEILQKLRARVNVTTPRILLAEAIEQLQLRVALSARSGNNRAARSLANLDRIVELARPFDVRGLRSFVRHLQLDWDRRASRQEGRIDASKDAVEIVTIHSAKGLEWPVVIPINMGTRARPSERFVHRQSDNTLHWIIGGVCSSALKLAREEQAQRQTLEHQRMWYVASTRARDLLVVPNLSSAKPGAWSKLLNLRFDLLEELQFNQLEPRTPTSFDAVALPQDADIFARQAAIVKAASPSLRWTNPSAHDADRAEILLPALASESSGVFEHVEPIGAGRTRGLALHKLMEELLTGELSPQDDVAARAEHLLNELLTIESEEGSLPVPSELAATALQTYRLPYVQRLLPVLVPELSVWGEITPGNLLAGRVDAIAIEGGKVLEVLDWKSDRDTRLHRVAYVQQLQGYLQAISAPRGAIVFMTTGEIVPVLHAN